MKSESDVTTAATAPVRPKDRFLVFGAPLISDAEIDEVVDSMRAGWLGTGPKVKRFEREFCAYTTSPHAVAASSCTAALHLSLLAARIKPGDEVITTPLTFCATVNAIIHAGGTPVLADVDPATMNIDPAAIRAKLSPRTRALLPVHFAGRACDLDAITGIVRDKGLLLIEDCAHAIETTYHGRKVGTFGDFGCFSFYATKNVSTGEGGMVITPREEDATLVRMLGLHGMDADAWKRFTAAGYRHYFVQAAGFKYNMMDLQAAIGIHQLARVEQNLVRREAVWRRYDEAFADLPIGLPAAAAADTRHARHLYTILVEKDRAGIDRDTFLTELNRHNIGAGVHYLSVPEHPFYRERFGWRAEDTPHATRIGRATLSLPLTPKLTDADVDDVIRAVRLILGKR